MKTILLSLLLIGSVSIVSADNIDKGQKFYLKNLKSYCKANGAKFAIKHTQDEWNELYTSKKLNEEINKECNKEFIISEENLGYLKDFFFEFASDSGNVPSCG